MTANQAVFPVQMMARLMGVSRSGFTHGAAVCRLIVPSPMRR